MGSLLQDVLRGDYHNLNLLQEEQVSNVNPEMHNMPHLLICIDTKYNTKKHKPEFEAMLHYFLPHGHLYRKRILPGFGKMVNVETIVHAIISEWEDKDRPWNVVGNPYLIRII